MKLNFLILLTLLVNVLSAQTNLTSYEYWFNNDYANVTVQAITPAQQHELNTNLDVSALPNNVNVLNIRYKDENGLYSSTLSKLFVKLSPATASTPNLVAYEYWFNNDYANAQVGTISPTQQHVLNDNLDVSALPNNVNVLNIRYKGENGVYSSTLSKLFVKLPPASLGTPNLVSYEYWFNNDYANVKSETISPAQQHVLNDNLDVSALPNNVNVLNVRYKDENGIYSSTLSKLFVKLPNATANNNKLTEYEYWFNNDYANAQVGTISPTQQHVLNDNLDVSALPNNVNVLNIRYKGENGVYSSTLSKLFVKLPNSTAINNKIISYQYWIDEDFADKKVVNLTTAVQQVNVLGDLDMSQITKGNHTLYVQFLDTLGVWSVVNHHDFEKESFPISDFDYALTANCDSTIVTFTDKSIDGDTYLWDFGDGNTSTDASPEYVYYNPGTYLVSQTVTDTLTLADSTTIQTVVITGRTYGSTTQVACNSYTSPSGKIYTTTGVHNDTITNHLGCDSIIAINLTINNSTTYTDVQTACGSYTWIDGETYTANNNTATHILTNAAGCDSLVTLNLTIKPNPSINVTQEEIVLTATQTGASYQWLDCDNGNAPIANENGNVFTATQNGNYAVEISMNGCIDTSICYPVTTVGIVEATFDHAIAVYPNPTNGQVTIDLGKIYDNVAVTVQSINGQVVKQVQYQNQKLLDLSLDVSNGIYVISLVSNDKTAVLRVEKH